MPSPAIETHHLRKVYNGDKLAVADLCLSVERGEVFGFLGPNGAGKTTSVKMLLGLVTPTAGHGELMGEPLNTPQARIKVGFLPEHFRFHDWLTASEFLRLHANLYQMPRGQIGARVTELLELVALTPHSDKKLRAFSKGMLQRVGLAQALLNHPELVILDEPTSGLDPAGRRMVRDIIKDLKSLGTTIFLNSHFLSEVEVTCDRVAFIKDGRIVRSSQLDELAAGELNVEIRATNLTPEVIAGLAQWSAQVRPEPGRLWLTLPDDSRLPEINRYLVAEGVNIYAISPEHLSLEDLFIQIVGSGTQE